MILWLNVVKVMVVIIVENINVKNRNGNFVLYFVGFGRMFIFENFFRGKRCFNWL